MHTEVYIYFRLVNNKCRLFLLIQKTVLCLKWATDK